MAIAISSVVSLTNIKAACRNCDLRELCLPLGLTESDMDMLDKAIRRRRTLKKGGQLYRMGEKPQGFYAIRQGAFKTIGVMEDGRAQITGFHVSGELLGIDAVGSDNHPCTAEALDNAEVCEIPYAAFDEVARQVPGLQHQLLRIMGREIAEEERLLLMIGRMHAEERLAATLVSFSQRNARLGRSPTEIKLCMSRQDLGDYLGLALETVSRLFSRLQDHGLIEVKGRQLRFRDVDGLREIARGNGVAAQPAATRVR